MKNKLGWVQEYGIAICILALYILIKHWRQWDLPLQIDAIGYLYHSGLYKRDLLDDGIPHFIFDVFYPLKLITKAGGWGLKSFTLQWYNRLFHYITDRPQWVLTTFSILCSVMALVSLKSLARSLSLNKVTVSILILFSLSVGFVFCSRGGWQQDNANAFMMAWLALMFSSGSEAKTYGLVLLPVIAFLTHAEAVYSLLSIVVILFLEFPQRFKLGLKSIFIIFLLFMYSALLKSSAVQTDVRPEIFFNNPTESLQAAIFALRDFYGISLFFSLTFFYLLIKKQWKNALVILTACFPWLAQVLFHFAKNESKHYSGVFPALVLVFAVVVQQSRLLSLAAIPFAILASAESFIYAYVSDPKTPIYGSHATVSHLGGITELVDFFSQKNICEVFIFDRYSEFYTPNMYIYAAGLKRVVVSSSEQIPNGAILALGNESWSSVKLGPEFNMVKEHLLVRYFVKKNSLQDNESSQRSCNSL